MDAEVKFTFAIVKHNAPFQLAESLSPLIQDSFSDSKVANYMLAREQKLVVS